MATEEEVCLESYRQGLEDLRDFPETKKMFEEAASKKGTAFLNRVHQYMNNEHLTKAIDNIGSGFKYMRPEMNEGLTELLTFLKSDEYDPTMHIYEAVERIHNSLSLKDGYEDFTKQCENILGMLGQKLKEKT